MEKVNRKKISKILIICILVCALSITTFAEYRQEFNDKVASFRLWGRTSATGVDSWREITINKVETGVYETAYQTYAQFRQRAVFAFPRQILVSNIYLQYTFAINPDIYSPDNISFSDYEELIAYTVQDYGPNASTAWFPEGSQSYKKSVTDNEITYTFKYNGKAILMRSVRAFTSLTTVSTKYQIKNITLVINDEEMEITGDWDDTVKDAQSMLDQMTMDMPDQEDYVNDIKSNIRPYDESVLRTWGFMGESHFLTTIVLMTIAFATISFILYGKKEAK